MGDEADFEEVELGQLAARTAAREAPGAVAEAQPGHGAAAQGQRRGASGIVDRGDHPQAARILGRLLDPADAQFAPVLPAQRQALEAPQQPQKAEQIPAYPDEGPGQYDPAEDPDEPEGGEWGDEGAASGAWGEPQSTEEDICADCHRKIISPPGKNWKVSDIVAYSKRIYGRALCQVCQDKARSAQRGGR